MASEIILGLYSKCRYGWNDFEISRSYLKTFVFIRFNLSRWFDSTLGVILDENLVVPVKHKLFKTALVRNPTLNGSILEPSMNLSGKGVLVAKVVMQPNNQREPVQIINHGTTRIKLYKGMSVRQLNEVDDEYPADSKKKIVWWGARESGEFV